MYSACRMMSDGSCRTPCYAEDNDCNLTVVKIFLAKHLDSKDDPPVLFRLNSTMWHGLYINKDNRRISIDLFR